MRASMALKACVAPLRSVAVYRGARGGAYIAVRSATRPVVRPVARPLAAGRLYTTPPAPQRARATLGPDASNPTKVAQPAFTRSGQLLRVDVTAEAASKLRAIREADQRPALVLRIFVESGGCHGFQYVFKLEDDTEIRNIDSIFERDGSRVVIDHKSLRILRDATVDYSTELIGSQFKVQSPHTSSSCGCGSSFSLDMED